MHLILSQWLSRGRGRGHSRLLRRSRQLPIAIRHVSGSGLLSPPHGIEEAAAVFRQKFVHQAIIALGVAAEQRAVALDPGDERVADDLLLERRELFDPEFLAQPRIDGVERGVALTRPHLLAGTQDILRSLGELAELLAMLGDELNRVNPFRRKQSSER